MNIDEFLDSVAAQNLSKAPLTAAGVHSVPSDALVRNVMQSKFDAIPKPVPPKAGPQSATTPQQNPNAELSVASISRSPSSSATPLAQPGDPLANAVEQFESLSVALETSLASADYQHAFDTYIALQSTLAHLHEQQKKQQRAFQERLNLFKTRLFNSVQESTAQFQSVMQELYVQIGQIKQLVDANQIEQATSQYASVKQTLDQLPNNFADKKEKLQDELLKVYLYLKDRSETHTANSFSDISNDMKRLYVSAVAAIKVANWAQAQQLYEQLAAKYAQLPDGFTEQKVQLFDYVTFLHSQLTLDPAIVAQTAMQSAPLPKLEQAFATNTTAKLANSAQASTKAPQPTQSTQLTQTVQQTQTAQQPQSAQSTPSLQSTPSSPQLASQSAQVTAQTTAPIGVPRMPASMRTPTISKKASQPETKTQPSQSPSSAQSASATQPNTTQSKIPAPPESLLDMYTPQQQPQIILTQRAAAKQPTSSTQSAPAQTKVTDNAASAPQKAKSQNESSQKATTSSSDVKPLTPDAVSAELQTNSAQQLQERARKLAARLEELKKSLDN